MHSGDGTQGFVTFLRRRRLMEPCVGCMIMEWCMEWLMERCVGCMVRSMMRWCMEWLMGCLRWWWVAVCGSQPLTLHTALARGFGATLPKRRNNAATPWLGSPIHGNISIRIAKEGMAFKAFGTRWR